MKISRMAEENTAPTWAFEDIDQLAKSEFINQYITQAEVERVQSLPEDNLSESQVIEQREVIEACSNDNTVYHYSSEWSDDVKASLKEYATVCGLDESKFKAVHPEYIEELKVEATAESILKKEADVQNDPFKLDTAGDLSHMEESNWEDIHKQNNLEQRPSMEGSVVPMRGGEDYYANSDPQTARGQNSITQPDAIETLANSEEEDTGARLRRENEERANSRDVKHQAWQDEKVAAMEGSEIIPKGTVFPTEVLNAQPGLESDKIHMGVYSDFDPQDMPDKTDGERLAELNEERRQEIQGAPKEDHDFKPEAHNARSISDSFADQLKKHLK
jgi:hypothetical protein